LGDLAIFILALVILVLAILVLVVLDMFVLAMFVVALRLSFLFDLFNCARFLTLRRTVKPVHIPRLFLLRIGTD